MRPAACFTSSSTIARARRARRCARCIASRTRRAIRSRGTASRLRAARRGRLDALGPGRPQADGEPIAITGRILDEDLRPVRRTLVEIWNANAHGRYSHIIDAGRNDAPLDPNFYGFGRAGHR